MGAPRGCADKRECSPEENEHGEGDRDFLRGTHAENRSESRQQEIEENVVPLACDP